MEGKAFKVMARDYFIDALNDRTLELKIQEKAPRHPNAAYKEALHLEIWQQKNGAHPMWDAFSRQG